MASKVAIDTESLAEDALYTLYQGQNAPQSVSLTLSESGEIGYEIEALGGGVSSYRWLSRTLAWCLPIVPSPASLLELIKDLRPLLERVHAGHSILWDGSNHRGYLTDDASEANDEIERYINSYAHAYDCVGPSDPDDPHGEKALYNYGNFIREI